MAHDVVGDNVAILVGGKHGDRREGVRENVHPVSALGRVAISTGVDTDMGKGNVGEDLCGRGSFGVGV
jgi:hypothetical protein